jgi:hypothetical protein
MKIPIAATAGAAAALVAASMLGIAAAEAPPPAPQRIISVEGVATVPIAQGSNVAAATSAYRQGMAAAVADGQSKAEFLAGKAATTLGAVQSIVEGGGSISCTDAAETAYSEYLGEQPDFGSSAGSVGPVRLNSSAAVGAPSPVHKRVLKRSKHRPAPSAKKAAATSCTLSAQVALSYAIV